MSAKNQQRFGVCLPEVLKELIEEKKVRLIDISRETGIAFSTLYDWVNGTYTPKVDWKIAALAKYFNKSVDYLFFGVDLSDQEKNSDNFDFNMPQTFENVDEDQVSR